MTIDNKDDKKSQEWGLNPRPARYECAALPTELSRQNCHPKHGEGSSYVQILRFTQNDKY